MPLGTFWEQSFYNAISHQTCKQQSPATKGAPESIRTDGAPSTDNSHSDSLLPIFHTLITACKTSKKQPLVSTDNEFINKK